MVRCGSSQRSWLSVSKQRGCPGETQREPQKEEQGGEGWRSLRRKEAVWRSSESTSLLRCALGRFIVEERVGIISCNPVALQAVTLQALMDGAEFSVTPKRYKIMAVRTERPGEQS